jgi:predicted DNA-binding ribbon-helix-helix protein
MTATATDYLETYLQDHRAGAEMGADLARRMHAENEDTQYAEFLDHLADEIAEDLVVLEQLMDRLDVDRSMLKNVAAKAAEKVGRLKPNNQLTGYSPLSRVLEFEGLRSGVQGKLALWDSLMEIAPFDERLAPDEIAQLIIRAEAQLKGLRVHHRLAAREAFATV